MVCLKEKVNVSIDYGLGATCRGQLDPKCLANEPLRSLMLQVASLPQASVQAGRTAAVLSDVLRGSRPLDVEYSKNAGDATGTPVNIDEALLKQRGDNDDVAEEQDVVLRVSEPYRGGTRV